MQKIMKMLIKASKEYVYMHVGGFLYSRSNVNALKHLKIRKNTLNKSFKNLRIHP